MAKKDKSKPTVEIVKKSYQPSIDELNEHLEFREGVTPERIAKGLVTPVNVKYIDRPNRGVTKKKRPTKSR